MIGGTQLELSLSFLTKQININFRTFGLAGKVEKLTILLWKICRFYAVSGKFSTFLLQLQRMRKEKVRLAAKKR